MRIGTWNLQGRWDPRHAAVIEAMDCNVLLLTEVSERVELDLHSHHTEGLIAPKRWWAAVYSRTPLKPLEEPHGATAFAEVDGLRLASSILPWRGCLHRAPWVGQNTATKTLDAVARILEAKPDIWGGDWNHALSGPETAGSKAGRMAILKSVESLALQVPTWHLSHRIPGSLSIDHIAVPKHWSIAEAERFVAETDGVRISDHDAYVVETQSGAADS